MGKFVFKEQTHSRSTHDINKKYNEIFTFDASDSFDPDGDPLRYEWAFGNGYEYKEGKTIEHRFSDSGDQTVTLTVIDPLGKKSSVDVTVNISAREFYRREPNDDIGDRFLPENTTNITRTKITDPSLNPQTTDGEYW